ncbi:MAG: hypothetical protein NUW24_10970 [Anaerolineae bacterium]|jgi:hypothetical protein|nr:hypothetical protein [Anaerolineae bacterium]MDH7475132.1 hypothetical protein [Anaerolineae bacterium]
MMYQDTYFVPKRTGTYADVFLAYGLATFLDRLAGQAKGEFARPRIEIADAGPYYEIRLGEPVRAEWIPDGLFFRSPAPFLTNRRTQADEVPPDTSTRDVDKTWDQVRAYQESRSALWGEGIRGSDLEQQLRDQEPPGDWTIVAFLGDWRMQAMGIYNRIVAQWAADRSITAEHARVILQLFATPDSDESALKAWKKVARGLRVQETASQLLNPHQGKGLNEPKANALRMDNIKDRPWLEEFLKTVGLWACLVPRRVVDVEDWKAYVLAPLRLDWRVHQEVMARFNRYLWNERRRDETSLKSDATSLLLFTRAWLDYVEAAGKDNVDFDADPTSAVPEKVVAGFHVAQFKLLSRNAYTMVNLSFLNLPRWTGTPRSRAEVLALKEVIDEHLSVIREIDETRSDGYNLLRAYRDFVAGNNWSAFFEFAAGYSHEIIRRYNAGARWVPTFSPSQLRRLIMAGNKPLSPIVENEGFQNVAYAIRYSTIIPQGRKAQNKDSLYDVRYGLGAELKRKATVRDEFIVALSEFMQSYNQENSQKLENTGQQMRRDLRTTDIEEVVRLVDEYGSEVVANLLIAYGYAREPRETEPDSAQPQN